MAVRSRRRTGLAGLALASVLALGAPSPALADEYEATAAGHPLRLAAYLMHPIGAFFDYVFLRPAHWLVHQEPFDEIFGHEHDDY